MPFSLDGEFCFNDEYVDLNVTIFFIYPSYLEHSWGQSKIYFMQAKIDTVISSLHS